MYVIQILRFNFIQMIGAHIKAAESIYYRPKSSKIRLFSNSDDRIPYYGY